VRKTKSNYGIPGEEAFIDLEQTRIDGRAVIKDLGFVETLTLSATGGDYAHSEIEFDGAVGTVFESSGYEGRIEARHKPISNFDGLWGIQFGSNDFSAIGEEAFILPVTITQAGIFGFERYSAERWGGEIGARFERRKYSGEAGQRDFDLTSFSLGGHVKPIEALRLSLTASRTQRAPTEVELFADGPHAATGAFELGDPSLKVETATTFEAGLRWQLGSWRAHADIWQADFEGFVSFSPTGEIEDDLPLFVVTQRDATLKGFELAADGTLWTGSDWEVLGDVALDYVEGRYKEGDNIARIPPPMLTVGLEAKRSQFGLRGEMQHRGKQDESATFETPTDAATIYNLSVTWQPIASETGFEVRLDGRNLGDAEVREHTSFLKDALPKPGRSIRLSLRAAF
jgi:iron complex outermembrane recepter protein